ncbi:MAG: carboxypeptidase regulatory-like domain-containing protein, partial [Acidobacteria bacterium]|nr:carboxypeptidase regulatory-like domain-containing protein [Acidobacteriota bacterium]
MQSVERNRSRRRANLTWLAGICACLLLAPGLAEAQQIGGTVTDATGGVLPGVTVEARSPALIEQVRTATTDGNGQYLIVALETGEYSVTYSLAGFGTVVREGVQLNTGFTATLDIQLSVGDIQETITVSGATPVVDIQNVEQVAVMDREVIDSIPTGKSLTSYGLLVPGMVGAESYG